MALGVRSQGRVYEHSARSGNAVDYSASLDDGRSGLIVVANQRIVERFHDTFSNAQAKLGGAWPRVLVEELCAEQENLECILAGEGDREAVAC